MAISFFPSDPVIARSIADYNAGLDRQQALHTAYAQAVDSERMRQQTAMQEAQMRQQYQQQALQQSAAQQAQQNDLARQELQQRGFFQQGTLDNQKLVNDRMIEAMKAEGGLKRDQMANDIKKAEILAGKNAPGTAEIEGLNNRAISTAGRLNAILGGMRDSQSAEEAKAGADSVLRGNEWTTFKSTAAKERDTKLSEIRSRYQTQFNQLLQNVPKDEPVDFDPSRKQFVPRTITMPGASSGQTPPSRFFNSSVVDAPIVAPNVSFGQNPSSTRVAPAPPGVVEPQRFFRGVSDSWDAAPAPVHVVFPNGTEADMPAAGAQKALEQFGAKIVQPEVAEPQMPANPWASYNPL